MLRSYILGFRLKVQWYESRYDVMTVEDLERIIESMPYFYDRNKVLEWCENETDIMILKHEYMKKYFVINPYDQYTDVQVIGGDERLINYLGQQSNAIIYDKVLEQSEKRRKEEKAEIKRMLEEVSKLL